MAGKPRILLVDDDVGFLKATSLVLRQAGYDVLTAQDERAGLAAAREHKPQVVVVDVIMTRPDGGFAVKRVTPEILEEIRRRVANELHPVGMYLFGSHAWGSPVEDSDVDIMLVLNRMEAPRAEYMRRAYRSIRELRVPAEFVVKTAEEVERYRTVKSSLVRDILERGRPL